MHLFRPPPSTTVYFALTLLTLIRLSSRLFLFFSSSIFPFPHRVVQISTSSQRRQRPPQLLYRRLDILEVQGRNGPFGVLLRLEDAVVVCPVSSRWRRRWL